VTQLVKNPPLKVLFVEDNEDDMMLALRSLRQGGFEPAYRRVESAPELAAALAQESWDAVISDFAMPGFTGLDALGIFRASDLDIPFILTSGTIGEATAVDAMKAGASDYIMKGNLARLVPALKRELKDTSMRTAHRAVQRDLVESEQRFRSLTALSSDWYWEQDAQFRFIHTSDKFVDSSTTRMGWAAGGVNPKNLGKTRWELPYKDVSEQQWTAHKAQLEAHLPFRDLQFHQDTDSGKIRHVSVSGEPIFDGDGRFTGYRGVGSDITERKEAEARIGYLNRVYAILSGINSLIVRVRETDELFKEACRIAVGHGGFCMAMAGLVDCAAEKFIAVASAGKDEKLLGAIRATLASGEPAPTTMLARAIREKAPVVSNDSQNDSQVMFGAKYAAAGVRSMAVLPLVAAGEVMGTLGLYAEEPGFFRAEEMKLLAELAGDIAFALENIGRQHKLDKLAHARALSSEISAAIIRIGERDQLFAELCRIVVERGGYKMAWIGVTDRDKMKVVPIASAGAEAEFLTVVRDRFSLREDLPGGNTMNARAVRSKQAVVSNDIRDDPNVVFAKDRIARGILSIAVLPLMVANEAVGVLNLFAGEAGFFDEEELSLLTEMAGNIAFAMDRLQKGEKLSYLAYYDSLTGLANQRLFLDRMAAHMHAASKSGRRLALYLIDLERFKNINDSLGQAAGDALLKQVAEWLTQNDGDASRFCRLGADHFAALLPDVDAECDLVALLEKTMAAFLDHPFRLNDAVFRIAAKVGVALFPNDGGDAETLYKNAEAALKSAKARGERYLFYAQNMTDQVAGKLSLENQLRRALDREEFVLHYQPKVSLASGKVTSVEALIRWNDPDTGLVPPGHFIPILEETGLIYEVGRWALRKAVEDYLRWRNAGLPAGRVAVNISPLQLRNHGFVPELRQITDIDALAADGLELEITESLIMENVRSSISSLQTIRAMGICIAIDDFGTGFSSLSYLAKLPVDTLKIDRSFITEMTGSSQGLALVSTIIKLAHSLKLKVVAEGVETEEQSHLLRLLSCDEMQGYLFSKPLPAALFESRFLTRDTPAKADGKGMP
jgi:diguanylate cyclase (GGDEF)-like protein/PAS domain S-box-containing protein